jgi:predicted NBD/HSP70 family sugar kinase
LPRPAATAPRYLGGKAPQGTSARSAAPARPRPIVAAPQLRVSDAPGAIVLRQARGVGPVTRDVVTAAVELSAATVNRHVAALLEAGLLRERADLVPSGAVGRPRVPFELNTEPYAVVAVHIGTATTSIVAADVRGKLLGGITLATPTGPAAGAVAAIAASAQSFAARWRKRTLLWGGVAIGGRVDTAAGVVDHPRLGWSGAPVGAAFSSTLGVPVSVAGHVEAMAAAELLLAPGGAEVRGSSLYFYAREMAGIAITFDGRVHSPSGGPGDIAHLPTGSSARCRCGAAGCLEATVSDRAVLAEAVATGVLPDGGAWTIADLVKVAGDGSAPAAALLDARARTLGRALAMLSDVFNPDRILLGGQAFTEYPAGVRGVAASFAQASALGRKDIRISGFGSHVQEHASAAVALSNIFADPVAAMRRAAA